MVIVMTKNWKNTRQLSWNEVQKARELYEDEDSDETIRSLASRFGIGKTAMHKILTYQTYKEPSEEAGKNVR